MPFCRCDTIWPGTGMTPQPVADSVQHASTGAAHESTPGQRALSAVVPATPNRVKVQTVASKVFVGRSLCNSIRFWAESGCSSTLTGQTTSSPLSSLSSDCAHTRAGSCNHYLLDRPMRLFTHCEQRSQLLTQRPERSAWSVVTKPRRVHAL
jgi:hypothetical protein